MRRSRFQFGLKALFVLVTLAGVVAYGGRYVILRRQVSHAEYQYEHANMLWNISSTTSDSVCDASETLLEAELRVPFSNAVQAMSNHVERLGELQIYMGKRLLSTRDGIDEMGREFGRLRDLREQAEGRLRQEQDR